MSDFQHAGAFVVQFRPTTDFDRGPVEGRIEHIASGLTAHFTSTGELLDMLARLWRNVRTDDEPGRTVQPSRNDPQSGPKEWS